MLNQQTTESMFSNNTGTAREFADVMEGDDTAILENNVNIGNPNNNLSSNVETRAKTLGKYIMILGEDGKMMLKSDIDKIEQIAKQDLDALLARIRSLQIP
jgi:hypothetical protein